MLADDRALTSHDDATDATPHRPGRPRSVRAERAIHEAALTLLVEQGYEGMSVEAVAARAGVGKATIYRRYDGKQPLVAAALRTLNPPSAIVLPDTGSVRGDLQLLSGAIAQVTLGSVVGPMIARVLSAATANPELRHIFHENLLQPRRAAVLAILRRGVERGELRPDLDLELALDMLVGAIFYRVLFGGQDLAQFPAIVPHLVDIILRGVGVHRE